MKRLYFAAMALLILGTLAMIMKFGIKPRPTGVMKPSFFAKPEEIGAVTYRRLYAAITAESVVAIGVMPDAPAYPPIVEGFVAAAALEKHPFAVVFKERGLPAPRLPADVEVHEFDFKVESDPELIRALRAYVDQGKRVLLYSLSIYTSHVLRGNPITRFEQEWGGRILSISAVGLPLRREQEPGMQPSCVGGGRDGEGTARLGCVIIASARPLYRKNLDQSQFVAMANQQGGKDYLLFVSVPRNGQQAALAPSAE